MFTLSNPIVQTAVVPLIVSFVAVGLLRVAGGAERGRLIAALAVGLGLLVAYWVIFGIPSFPPTGATRKMFYLIAAAALIGLVADVVRVPVLASRLLTVLAGIAAIAWIGGDKALGDPWPAGVVVLCLLVVLAIAGWHLVDKSEQPTEPGVPLLVVALGLTIIAFLGNTASSAQLAGAIAAALGGFLIWNWPKPRFALGAGGLLPTLALLAALATQLALFTKIEAYVLIPLGLGLFTGLAIPKPAAGVLRPIVLGVATALPVALAVLIAYLTTPQSTSPY